MQDAIGIGLLIGMALLFRLCFHSSIGFVIHRHNVVRAYPFNLIAFWVARGLRTVATHRWIYLHNSPSLASG